MICNIIVYISQKSSYVPKMDGIYHDDDGGGGAGDITTTTDTTNTNTITDTDILKQHLKQYQ